MRRGGGHSDLLRAALAVGSRKGRRRWERPSRGGSPQQGFALLAISGNAEEIRAPGLVIKQDRLNHGLHVTAHSLAVVVENWRDAIDVPAAGTARHEPLNQLAADEWTDILIVIDGIDRGFE